MATKITSNGIDKLHFWGEREKPMTQREIVRASRFCRKVCF